MQSGGFSYFMYSTGNSHNTWFACTLVDANGKEIPWVDRNGKVLKTVEERNHCAPGQRAFVYDGPRLIPDLPQRIASGEFKLPLYADLPGMPEHERRAIWGLMVGNEGKTRIPVYWTFQNWGFDPDKDMLQATVQPPDLYTWGAWWKGYGARHYRGMSGGGPVFDWDLKTNLPGFSLRVSTLLCGANHSGSATTGAMPDARPPRTLPPPKKRQPAANKSKPKKRAFTRRSTAKTAWAGKSLKWASSASCRTIAVKRRTMKCWKPA